MAADMWAGLRQRWSEFADDDTYEAELVALDAGTETGEEEEEEAPPPPTRRVLVGPEYGRYPFLTMMHHHAAIVLLVALAVAYLGHAIVIFEIEFVPAAWPSHYGTLFLLPLVLQYVGAELSRTTLTSRLFRQFLLGYAVVCVALVTLAAVGLYNELAPGGYMRALGGFRSVYVELGLYFEFVVLLVVVLAEHFIVAMLAGLVQLPNDRHEKRSREAARQLTAAMSVANMPARVLHALLAILIAILVAVLFTLHVEGFYAFMPSVPIARAGTFWFLAVAPHLALAVVGLIVLEEWYASFLQVYVLLAAIFAFLGTLSAVLELVVAMPVATSTWVGLLLLIVIGGLLTALEIIVAVILWRRPLVPAKDRR